MAASGISEHDEARRRECHYLRKAFLQREQKKTLKDQIQFNGQDGTRSDRLGSSSYERQMQQMRGQLGSGYDAKSVDRERRQAHLEQMRQEYSAKLANRYSSIDYQSQW